MKSLLRIAYFAILYSLLVCTDRFSTGPSAPPSPEIVGGFGHMGCPEPSGE